MVHACDQMFLDAQFAHPIAPLAQVMAPMGLLRGGMDGQGVDIGPLFDDFLRV